MWHNYKIVHLQRKTELYMNCQIDSGAEADIIPISRFKKLFGENRKLNEPTVNMTAYGGIYTSTYMDERSPKSLMYKSLM